MFVIVVICGVVSYENTTQRSQIVDTVGTVSGAHLQTCCWSHGDSHLTPAHLYEEQIEDKRGKTR